MAFAEHGFEGTSIRELCRDLDVSHNLIPQRFGSKEQLWYAAIDQGFGRMAAELVRVLGEAYTEPSGDPLLQLRNGVVTFVEVNAGRPSLLRIINQEAANPGPRLDYLFDTYVEPVRVFGEMVLRELARKGKVRTTSVALFYFLMTHGAGGALALPALAERFGEAVDPTDAAAVRRHAVEAVDVLFDGLIVTEPG